MNSDTIRGVIPLGEKAGFLEEVRIDWSTKVPPQETEQYTYTVPQGMVDLALFISCSLSHYNVCDAVWIRDESEVWRESESFAVHWDPLKADAHQHCQLKVINYGSRTVRARWVGETVFIDKRVFDRILEADKGEKNG